MNFLCIVKMQRKAGITARSTRTKTKCQTDRYSLFSPSGINPMCSSKENQSEKKEGKRDAGATLCDFLGMWVYFLVQGWYQNGFYFSSKAQTNALWVYESFLPFFSSLSQLKAWRRNLGSPQVKCNKYVFSLAQVKRTAAKDGGESASRPRTPLCVTDVLERESKPAGGRFTSPLSSFGLRGEILSARYWLNCPWPSEWALDKAVSRLMKIQHIRDAAGVHNKADCFRWSFLCESLAP